MLLLFWHCIGTERSPFFQCLELYFNFYAIRRKHLSNFLRLNRLTVDPKQTVLFVWCIFLFIQWILCLFFFFRCLLALFKCIVPILSSFWAYWFSENTSSMWICFVLWLAFFPLCNIRWESLQKMPYHAWAPEALPIYLLSLEGTFIEYVRGNTMQAFNVVSCERQCMYKSCIFLMYVCQMCVGMDECGWM
jgi:hypothetical protein